MTTTTTATTTATATTATTATTEPAARAFCAFRAEGRLYGIDVAALREVSTHVATTPIPQAPPSIRGLTNLRSRVYLVIDLRPLLGLPPAGCTPDSRLLILKGEVGEDLGILVDSGGDIVRVAAADIEVAAPPAAPDAAADGGGGDDDDDDDDGDEVPAMDAGVCRLERELMVILDAAAIVAEVARRVR